MVELRIRVKELLKKQEKNGNVKQLQKLYVIQKILEDDKAFFSIPVEDAINILKDLEFDDYKEKYLELISLKSFNENRWQITQFVR